MSSSPTFSKRRNDILEGCAPGRDPDDVAGAASLILGRISRDPTPEDAAFAHLLAFGLQDLWAIRELLKGD